MKIRLVPTLILAGISIFIGYGFYAANAHNGNASCWIMMAFSAVGIFVSLAGGFGIKYEKDGSSVGIAVLFGNCCNFASGHKLCCHLRTVPCSSIHHFFWYCTFSVYRHCLCDEQSIVNCRSLAVQLKLCKHLDAEKLLLNLLL